MHSEFHRATRYPFAANVELIDLRERLHGTYQQPEPVWVLCFYDKPIPRRDEGHAADYA